MFMICYVQGTVLSAFTCLNTIRQKMALDLSYKRLNQSKAIYNKCRKGSELIGPQ